MNKLKELDYVYVVSIIFRDENGRVDQSVFVYRHAEDAQLRFERLKEQHKLAGMNSPLISTATFMAGVYENFEQSLLAEGKISEQKVN
jgi:hypothetical protein